MLDPDALELRQTRAVSDVLRDVPGVAVSRVAGQTQVRLRGTEANHVLVLIDGIEVSDPFTGEFDFGTLAADEAGRVEVLRGQQSAVYGSDAIGGVIQYITPTGRETPGYRARVEAGSFGTINAAARAAGVSGDLDYALSGTINTTDGTSNARGGGRDMRNDTGAVSLKASWTASSDARRRGGRPLLAHGGRLQRQRCRPCQSDLWPDRGHARQTPPQRRHLRPVACRGRPARSALEPCADDAGRRYATRWLRRPEQDLRRRRHAGEGVI